MVTEKRPQSEQKFKLSRKKSAVELWRTLSAAFKSACNAKALLLVICPSVGLKAKYSRYRTKILTYTVVNLEKTYEKSFRGIE